MVVSEKTGNIKGIVLHFFIKVTYCHNPYSCMSRYIIFNYYISVYFEQITFVLRNGCGK